MLQLLNKALLLLKAPFRRHIYFLRLLLQISISPILSQPLRLWGPCLSGLETWHACILIIIHSAVQSQCTCRRKVVVTTTSRVRAGNTPFRTQAATSSMISLLSFRLVYGTHFSRATTFLYLNSNLCYFLCVCTYWGEQKQGTVHTQGHRLGWPSSSVLRGGCIFDILLVRTEHPQQITNLFIIGRRLYSVMQTLQSFTIKTCLEFWFRQSFIIARKSICSVNILGAAIG